MKNMVLLCMITAFFATPAGCSQAQSGKETTVALTRLFTDASFDRPVELILHPENDAMWFVLEQGGRLLMLDEGDPSAAAVLALDLRGIVDDSVEGGLLGMAFHPSFSGSGNVFLSYTIDGSPMVSRISRFHMGIDGSVDPGSERIILTVDQPAENHNGGCIAFGPDGFLYIGFGDGGGAGDPWGNGQDTGTLKGSILRIDVDGSEPYGIPADNPFYGSDRDRPELYAWGLRNPWRFSFDRSDGRLWAGDVGQNDWEEIDVVVRGGNYGWNIKEGTHCYAVDPCDDPSLIDPVAEYGHSVGRSVTGGHVYRGAALPSLAGRYVFGDFGSGRIWTLEAAEPDGATLLLDTSLRIVSFAEDRAGEIYVVDYAGGLYRINPPP